MAYESKNIRNVVLLGHPGSGKTSIAEDMLFEAKGITKRGNVGDGNTVSDYTVIEQSKGNSIFSTLMHASWKDSKINIIDTPGYDDFIGEVISSLKVADTAVMLINARSGVEVGTELIWEYIEQYKTPAMFVINHLDNDKADYEQSVQQAISRFGNKLIPVQYPLNRGNGFNSIIDALRMIMYVFPTNGGKPEKKPIPEAEMAKAMEMHNKLVEAAAENEEGLMDKFFEQGTLDEDDLRKGLRIALANQQIFPIFCASAAKNMGSGRIMGFINDVCPSPVDRPAAKLEDGKDLACDSKANTTIFIYKTITEPNVGNVSYFKVFSGSLK
ncbi:MAG TPA: GTP-binding protein, partial [Saprospiraceae bacterium]|nr:GTP-binding protein [Saprospiraceae bacterium]